MDKTHLFMPMPVGNYPRSVHLRGRSTRAGRARFLPEIAIMNAAVACACDGKKRDLVEMARIRSRDRGWTWRYDAIWIHGSRSTAAGEAGRIRKMQGALKGNSRDGRCAP